MADMVSQPLSIHQSHELVLKLEVAGLDKELAQRVIDSKGNYLATKVVRLIQNGGFEPTTSQKRAREIMCKDFFGVEEAIKHFGVNPTRQQLDALSEIPFSEAVLEQSKDTHILVAVFPLSTLEIRDKIAKDLFLEDAWYNKQSFAKEHGEISWQLIRKTPLENSTWKSWQEQQKLLGKDEEVPSAQVIFYTVIGHYLTTGEFLFEDIGISTPSMHPDSRRVVVGGFDSRGPYLYYWWGDTPKEGFFGLSSARKPEL
jgi:hypothetical protein